MRIRLVPLVFASLVGGAFGAAADDVVRVGVINDLSGPYRDLADPGSVVAAELAAEDFGGTVAGRTIEILSADHQNKPDVGSAIARRWYEEDGVDAIADVPTSSVALAIQEISRAQKKIFLISGGSVSAFYGKACSPYSIHTADDTHAYTVASARAVVESGGKTWFMLVSDYAAGHAIEKLATAAVTEAGGEVVGAVRHPQNTSDFSSFVLQAQGSGAQVVGLGNFGADTVNAIKQANEFGLTKAGQSLVSFGMFISEVHALGLETAHGLLLAESFYWDLNDRTREFAARFQARTGRKPTRQQATTYATIVHYLKAIQAAGTDEPDAVMSQMRSAPFDFFGETGEIRKDGRLVHDSYLWRVKAPEESKGPWDYYSLVRKIPAKDVFLPLAGSECPLAQ